MAGIYLHIPFCRKACTYCDFHFSTNLSLKAEMIASMAREISLRKDYFSDNVTIETIYLGGGTPSLLAPAELSQLIDAVKATFPISHNLECTLEANPENLTEENMTHWMAMGINRLSIGVQSFRDVDLEWMNRTHTATQALENIDLARDLGLTNFSIDLILGVPGMDLEAWRNNLRQALLLTPKHISVYALTVEEKTALYHSVKKGDVIIPPDEAYETQFMMADEMLRQAGFEHYELSNYAREGFRSRHNASYWQGKPYLGIGPSAHSYDGTHRSWNFRNNMRYIKAIAAGETAIEEVETLSKKDQANEYIMTQLRCKEGLKLSHLQMLSGIQISQESIKYLDNLKKKGLCWQKEGHLGLTSQGWLVSDSIIRELFIE